MNQPWRTRSLLVRVVAHVCLVCWPRRGLGMVVVRLGRRLRVPCGAVELGHEVGAVLLEILNRGILMGEVGVVLVDLEQQAAVGILGWRSCTPQPRWNTPFSRQHSHQLKTRYTSIQRLLSIPNSDLYHPVSGLGVSPSLPRPRGQDRSEPRGGRA